VGTTTCPSRSACGNWSRGSRRCFGARAWARPLPGPTAGDLVIDPNLHAALLDGEDVGLTPTEFRLLYVLAGERGRALTRDQLQQRVWGIPHRHRHRDRTVDVCVRKLRDKIDRRPGAHTYIQTHNGVGYRFDPVPKPTVADR